MYWLNCISLRFFFCFTIHVFLCRFRLPSDAWFLVRAKHTAPLPQPGAILLPAAAYDDGQPPVRPSHGPSHGPEPVRHRHTQLAGSGGEPEPPEALVLSSRTVLFTRSRGRKLLHGAKKSKSLFLPTFSLGSTSHSHTDYTTDLTLQEKTKTWRGIHWEAEQSS